MRYILSAFFSLCFSTAATSAQAQVIYELFTSQGCSSCPPADRIANTLADDPNILVLSYHVDYWNYLGWQDPYSSKQVTQRQRDYAAAMRSSSVYTPQLVINGTHDVVGSNRSEINRLLSDAKPLPVPTTVKKSGKEVIFNLPKSDITDAHLWLVYYDKRTSNVVPRGENAGNTLIHRNSVAKIEPIGRWDGTAQELSYVAPVDDHGIALLVQQKGGYGAIIGGAWL